MTPKQINDALTIGADYAAKTGRPARHRIMLSNSAVIDTDAAEVQGGSVRLIDTNGAIVFIDCPAVVLIANGLNVPESAEFEVQGGELDIPKQ